MKLGQLTVSTAVILACIAGTALWISWCHDPQVRREVLLTAAGDSTDARLARVVADQVVREAAWRRTETVISRQRDVSRQRADSLQNEVLAARNEVITGSDTLIPKPLVVAALAAKDSVIRADSSGTVARDARIAELVGDVRYLRDTTVVDLRGQRDTWKAKAERPRYTVTDIGGAALAGYGVSEKNETLVLLGAATVLAPRIVRGLGNVLGRIF